MYDAISLAITCVGAIGGLLWLNEWRRDWFEDRAFRAFFGPVKTSGALIVCPTQPAESESPNTATTYEDSLAQAELQTRLSRHDMVHGVKLHHQVDRTDLQRSLLLICGPVGNSITKMLFEALQLPYHFQQSDGKWAIADKTGTSRHFPTGDHDEDLALVVALRNPWSRPEHHSNVYLAAGINGLGTWGAAVQLASGASELAARLKAEKIDPKAHGFAAVIRVKRDQHRPPTTKILEVEAIATRGIAA